MVSASLPRTGTTHHHADLETANTKDESENILPQPLKMVGVSDRILANLPPASQNVLRFLLA